MAKYYFGRTNSGSHPHTTAQRLTAPPAAGPVMCLVDMGPTRGLEWQYSSAVDGVRTFYIVDLEQGGGKQKSPT